jgi:hypothetical protein
MHPEMQNEGKPAYAPQQGRLIFRVIAQPMVGGLHRRYARL